MACGYHLRARPGRLFSSQNAHDPGRWRRYALGKVCHLISCITPTLFLLLFFCKRIVSNINIAAATKHMTASPPPLPDFSRASPQCTTPTSSWTCVPFSAQFPIPYPYSPLAYAYAHSDSFSSLTSPFAVRAAHRHPDPRPARLAREHGERPHRCPVRAYP